MSASTPSRDLVHPLFLGAVGVLLVNDHALKGSGLAPGWLTGKLSDVAGLFFFPVLAFAVVDLLARGRARSRRRVVGGVLAALTAVGFALVKLVPSVNAFANANWGPMLLDPTDLVALPCAFLGWVFLVRARPDAERRAPTKPARSHGVPPWPERVRRFGALALAGLASMATPAPHRVRNYPSWRIEWLGARAVGCAELDAWVSKSGKEGFGVTLELEPLSEPCAVELKSARFLAKGVTMNAATLPPPATLAGELRTYVPFEFDNEALWNDGVRDGRLELVLAAGAPEAAREETRLEVALVQHWTGPHKSRLPAGPPP